MVPSVLAECLYILFVSPFPVQVTEFVVHFDRQLHGYNRHSNRPTVTGNCVHCTAFVQKKFTLHGGKVELFSPAVVVPERDYRFLPVAPSAF